VIAALILLILAAFGVTPSDEELAAYESSYWSKVHHIFIEIGSEVDEQGIRPTFAAGYEALLDPDGRGGAFEVVVEAIIAEEVEFFAGVGGGHYFHPKLRVGLTAGPLIQPGEDVLMRGRLDVAGRFLIFNVAVQPYARLTATTNGTYDFGFGGRFEY